jgi:N-acetylneuraminate lyase
MQQSAAQRRAVTETVCEATPAISSLPPIGGFPFEEIRDYCRALAGATGLPLLIYHFPALAPALNRLDQFDQLLAIPGVVGLKFTDSDFYKLAELMRRGAVVFNGSDEMLVAGLLRGAGGGIGSIYNLLPEAFAQLFALARRNEWAQASALQDDINTLIAEGLRFPVISAVNSLLRASGLDCGNPIAPRRTLSPEEEASLLAGVRRTRWASLFPGAG